jgi:hypothetical protein
MCRHSRGHAGFSKDTTPRLMLALPHKETGRNRDMLGSFQKRRMARFSMY